MAPAQGWVFAIALQGYLLTPKGIACDRLHFLVLSLGAPYNQP
jgi:hypothetical protein